MHFIEMRDDERRQLLDGAIDALPFTVLVLDADARIVTGNAAWHHSATAQKLSLPNVGIGESYIAVLQTVVSTSDDNLQIIARGLASVLEHSSRSFEHECSVWISGQQRWFRVIISTASGQHGAMVQHLETTASHAEQAAREEALAHFQAVFETTIDGIIIFNDDLQFLDGNPAIAQMLGFPVEFLRTRRMTDVLSPEQGEALRREQAELIQQGSKRGLLHARRPDGTYIDLEYVARANFLPGRHVAQLRDMTAARQLESQLRQAQKMQAVGQLTGGIAHDFNNLLTVIVAHADFLLSADTALAPNAREGVGEILRASQRGAEMVRKLMAFGRQERIRVEAVALDLLANDLTSMLRRLLPESVTIQCTAAERIPFALVDSGAVQQIVFNLATNARDAMASLGGTLRIHVDRENDAVVLVVADTGAGMDEDTLARMFDPFFTTKKIGEGTGLGMAMVYGLVEQMRGRIQVESQLGQGTTVTMRFPLADASLPIPTPTVAPSALATGQEQVLLVEDDEAIRTLARRVLQRGGYDVTVAEDGESAAQKLRVRRESGASPFALVVSDVVMPRGGGARVLDAMRQHAPATRLLWVTGYPGLDPQDGGAHAPSDAPLVQKPWTATELLQQVRAAIDGGTSLVA